MNELKFTGSIVEKMTKKFGNQTCHACGKALLPLVLDTGDAWFVDIDCINGCSENEESSQYLEDILWGNTPNAEYTQDELLAMGFTLI